MSLEKRNEGGRRRARPSGWTGSDSRDDAPGAADAPDVPQSPRPVVDSRGRAIITPNGFPLFL